jgi:hypothetical protein
MKKFLITLLILLIIGGAVFLFGWAQFSVPPGLYGVVNSKTHGFDPDVVRSGEFRWIWYKLIPTNVQIAVFRLEQTKFPVNFNSSLPSGDTYASFAGLTNANFSWELRGEISFRIDPDGLAPLAARNNLLGQEALDEYLQNAAKDIEIIILRTLSSAGSDSERIERIMSGNHDAEMENEIKSAFPEILDFSFVIHSAKYPDFILYRQLRLLYDEFLASQREYVTAAFGIRAENHIQTQLHFGELERYGELLTKYPILLEYMALEKNSSPNR